MLPATTSRMRSLLQEQGSWLDREFDRMLNRWFGDYEGSFGGRYPVDIWEDDEHVYVEAEMPGFRKEELDVSVEQGILTISAERRLQEGEEHGSHLRERRYGRYQRAFTLPTAVNDAEAEARLENGVLHLRFPKAPEVRPRRIALK